MALMASTVSVNRPSEMNIVFATSAVNALAVSSQGFDRASTPRNWLLRAANRMLHGRSLTRHCGEINEVFDFGRRLRESLVKAVHDGLRPVSFDGLANIYQKLMPIGRRAISLSPSFGVSNTPELQCLENNLREAEAFLEQYLWSKRAQADRDKWYKDNP